MAKWPDEWPLDWPLSAIRMVEQGQEREAALVKALEEIAKGWTPNHVRIARRALAAYRREKPR